MGFVNSEIGKQRRLSRLFRNRNIVITPLDDSLIDGAINGLENIPNKIMKIVKEPPDAVLAFAGLLNNHVLDFINIPTILNLSASTTRSNHTNKVLVSTIETGIKLGVEAVAVHVNISSKFESEMLKNIGIVSASCSEYGMPLIAIMYPRTEDGQVDINYDDIRTSNIMAYAEIVAHAARVGVDLGADVIKTMYTGTAESFQKVVSSCEPIPVIVAGGPIMDEDELVRMTLGAMEAGGRGVCYGRNIFGRGDPGPLLKRIKEIVHV